MAIVTGSYAITINLQWVKNDISGSGGSVQFISTESSPLHSPPREKSKNIQCLFFLWAFVYLELFKVCRLHTYIVLRNFYTAISVGISISPSVSYLVLLPRIHIIARRLAHKWYINTYFIYTSIFDFNSIRLFHSHHYLSKCD